MGSKSVALREDMLDADCFSSGAHQIVTVQHGKQDHGQAWIGLTNAAGSFKAVHNREGEIEDYDVWFEFRCHFDGGPAIWSFTANLPVSEFLDAYPDCTTKNSAVVYDKNANRQGLA